MDQRADKRYRIKTKGDLARVFQQGRRACDGLITLHAVRNGLDDGRCRLAVAVSTRHGGAVRRNRIKRLCREAFRLTRHRLPSGWDYVIVPRAEAELTVNKLAEAISSLAGRVTGQAERKENH